MDLQIGYSNSILVRNSETWTSDIKNRFVIVVLIFIYSRIIRKDTHHHVLSTAALKIRKFIEDNGIDLILYKGGCIEKQICKELGISSFNIEKLGKFEKPYSHGPYAEVNTYYGQLIQL